MSDANDGDNPQVPDEEMPKQEAISRLAGGVAHEFNNLLTIITGYTCVLLEAHGPGDADHDALTQIQSAAQRAALLVRQLLAVAGRQMLRPRTIDLNSVVLHLTDVFKRLLGSTIRLQINLDAALPSAEADVEALEQVLLDLIVNARDAMPAGGSVTVATTATYLATGRAVRLTVTDTGRGMDGATLTRLFEPFFTTKDVGEGTGLSLAAAHGLVKQCGGNLGVISQVGQGTTFTITLPARTSEPS